MHLIVALVLAAAVVAAVAPPAKADPPVRVTYTGAVGIHVWLEHPRSIYPDYGDVVIAVQATRSCYATVFIVDTFGFVHVIHPFSPWDSAWIDGGVTYRLTGHEVGLGGLGGRGIVHVFAIGSPYPFDYTPYGELVFVGRFGYRIYGDPYIACRQLGIALLPGERGWGQVGIASARFYVRDWVRYPVYLCGCPHGGRAYVQTGARCRHCGVIYDTYRVHVNDPQVVLRRAPRYKDSHGQSYAHTRVERSTVVQKKYQETFGGDRTRSGRARKDVFERPARNSRIVSAKQTRESVSGERARVTKPVRSTSVTKSRPPTSRSTAKYSGATKTKTQKGRVSNRDQLVKKR